MGGGYTPAFSTIYDGTLCGKWPTAVVWASLIPLIDVRGEIRMSHEAIAARTGWPMELLRQGIHDLMQPDPDSQSPAEEGRRLVLLDPTKSWGWRAVNHGLYREKARLMSKAQREVESGANKSRMDNRRRPPETAGNGEGPPETPSPDSYTNTGKRGRGKRASRVPADFEPDLDYAISQLPDIDASREAQKFRDWEFKTPRSDWTAVWRNWVEQCRESGKYARRTPERRFQC
jgi:hypothetical protein